MAVKNSTILAKAWLEGTNDYQQRVPNATQASISAQMDAIFSPMNRNIYNQFVDTLVNRIGFTFVRQQAWQNPLEVFKSGKLNYGSTVQEIGVQWVKAHSYQDDAETLLKMHRPEVEAAYHTINRQDQYPITVSKQELQQAFVDEYGLNALVSGIMQAPINSDNYDEYRIMLQLIGEYEDSFGFYKHQLTAAPEDEASAKELLKAIRTYKGKLGFPSTIYNASPVSIPVFARPEELVLFITPEYDASIDVDALAALFNLEKAEAQIRKIIVDEFPIPNAVALLTTDDFYVAKDTVYENDSFYNPQTMTTNYFLNHWSILSVSPFVPAILFTTDAGTEVETITQNVTGLTVNAGTTALVPGDNVQLTAALTGTVTPDDEGIELAPEAVTWSLTAQYPAADSNPAQPIELNSRTYVDKNNVLHVQKTWPADESGAGRTAQLKAVAVSTYDNPSGDTAILTDDLSFTVTIA